MKNLEVIDGIVYNSESSIKYPENVYLATCILYQIALNSSRGKYTTVDMLMERPNIASKFTRQNVIDMLKCAYIKQFYGFTPFNNDLNDFENAKYDWTTLLSSDNKYYHDLRNNKNLKDPDSL